MTNTQKSKDLLRVVAIFPDLPAFEGVLGSDLKSMQRAVGGLIEVTYPFQDSAILLGNEEAKLRGMPGNRRIGREVYAGPLFVIGDTGGSDFCSLSDKQITLYCQRFAQPEGISDEEVQDDLRSGFIIW